MCEVVFRRINCTPLNTERNIQRLHDTPIKYWHHIRETYITGYLSTNASSFQYVIWVHVHVKGLES